MGFRHPLTTATELDTGGTGSRVVITERGGTLGGGAVEVYPESPDFQDPGALEAGADPFGPWAILSAPPNHAGERSSITLRTHANGAARQGVVVDSTGPYDVYTPAGEPLRHNGHRVSGAQWVEAVKTAPTYSAQLAGSWTGLLDFSAVTVYAVPAGRVLDVEWRAPRVTVAANGQSQLRLMIDGVQVDVSDWSTGGGASLYTGPRLAGSVDGAGADIVISVQGRAPVGPGFVQGAGLGPVLLRYRIS